MNKIIEGPVKYQTIDIEYYGPSPNSFSLPSEVYEYPGGSIDCIEDYGGYYGVRWSVDQEASPVDAVLQLATIKGIDPEVNGFEFEINSERILMDQWSPEQAALCVAACDDFESWSYTCGVGTYFWDEGTEDLTRVGVLTYNDAPVEPIRAWKQATASLEIRTRLEAMQFAPERAVSTHYGN